MVIVEGKRQSLSRVKTRRYFWPNERVKMLHKLLGNGLTHGQIAAQLGVTTCAVIGKVNRLRLSDSENR